MAVAAPTLPVAVTGVVLVAVLLSQFALLRCVLVGPAVRIYAIQSLAVCVFTGITGFRGGDTDLYVLAGLTLITKVIVIPLIIGIIVRRLAGEDRVRLQLPVPQSLLIAALLAAIGFAAASHLGPRSLLTASVGVGLAVLLMGFFLIVVRPNAIAQLIGFLTLENAVFVSSLSLAPGLSLIVAVLLLLDVLLPAAAFGLLIRVLNNRVRSVHTAELTELRG